MFAAVTSDGKVHVYDLAPVPLAREDPDAAAIVIAALENENKDLFYELEKKKSLFRKEKHSDT